MNNQGLTILGLILLLVTILKISADSSEDINVIQSENQGTAAKSATSSKDILLTAKIYAKLFEEQRKEQKIMVKRMLKFSYEKHFKMLKLAYTNIFEILSKHNVTLISNDYQLSKSGFPQSSTHLQEAVILILENCCIAAECVLHFPEMSLRIFRQTTNLSTNWKSMLNWCIDFTNSLSHIIDESTVKLMELLQQEINEELRTEAYVNPYYKQQEPSSGSTTNRKKPRKKLKKGPQISGGSSKTEL